MSSISFVHIHIVSILSTKSLYQCLSEFTTHTHTFITYTHLSHSILSTFFHFFFYHLLCTFLKNKLFIAEANDNRCLLLKTHRSHRYKRSQNLFFEYMEWNKKEKAPFQRVIDTYTNSVWLHTMIFLSFIVYVFFFNLYMNSIRFLNNTNEISTRIPTAITRFAPLVSSPNTRNINHDFEKKNRFEEFKDLTHRFVIDSKFYDPQWMNFMKFTCLTVTEIIN